MNTLNPNFPSTNNVIASTQPALIVSLTSFPARINTVHICIHTLLQQSKTADKIILWLAEEEFPNKEASLPNELLQLTSKGLEIEWYHNIRSYKKLIPALIKYPDDIIVTADDDNQYPPNWLELLYSSYLKEPNLVHCHRVTKFYYENNEFKIITGGQDFYKSPSYLNKLVGLGGVLYPPHVFYKDILNEPLFMELAPTSDDLWFWLMCVLNQTRIHVVEHNIARANYIPTTQEGPCLTKINDHGEKLFFVHFHNILNHYPILKNLLIMESASDSTKYMNQITTLNNLVLSQSHCIKEIQKELTTLKSKLQSTNKHVDYCYYKGLHPSQYKAELCEWFYKRTGEILNLENPITYNEKIQWLKLYDSTPLKSRLADKFLVREWIKEQIGEKYLIPLLGVWNHFNEINFDELPNQFVLKCNHACGWNMIVKNKQTFNQQHANYMFTKWLSTNFAYLNGFELHYKPILPKIIAEEYIENLDGQIFDYRFYTFHGKVAFVWVDLNSGTPKHTRNIYDINWNLSELKVSYPNIPFPISKPKNYDLMLSLATKLSQSFIHARVDFYDLDDRVYFGEITFTPQSGAGKWAPTKYNTIYGNYIHLPDKSLNNE